MIGLRRCALLQRGKHTSPVTRPGAAAGQRHVAVLSDARHSSSEYFHPQHTGENTCSLCCVFLLIISSLSSIYLSPPLRLLSAPCRRLTPKPNPYQVLLGLTSRPTPNPNPHQVKYLTTYLSSELRISRPVLSLQVTLTLTPTLILTLTLTLTLSPSPSP